MFEGVLGILFILRSKVVNISDFYWWFWLKFLDIGVLYDICMLLKGRDCKLNL